MSSPLYLYHHGILGQKWGKRNGPPYPLGPSDHSSSEKRAGWNKSLKKQQKKYDKKFRKNYYKAYNKAADYINANVEKINERWEKEFKGYSNWADSPKYEKYEAEFKDMFQSMFEQSMEELIGKRPE